MVIAGLQNLSLVDYPGFLSAVVFLQGCNFRCGYCQNPDLVTLEKKFDFSEEKVFKYLNLRKDQLEAVVISGGEPAIYNDLPDFLEKIKALGLKIKFDTNGSRPGIIEDLIKRELVDYIAVDIKTSLPKYKLVTDEKNIQKKIKEAVKLIMLSTVDYEFRTTCVPGIVDEKDIHKIGKLVKGASKYFLQQFRSQVTYSASFGEVKPYEKETLERFAEVLRKYVQKVGLRGV